ncbi:hypothetical protein C8Q78DRAFT_1083410 [Trametes maxima]|nr:hypothetical protein C8Q78DRAFT_1083410 [Trametes maxima]
MSWRVLASDQPLRSKILSNAHANGIESDVRFSISFEFFDAVVIFFDSPHLRVLAWLRRAPGCTVSDFAAVEAAVLLDELLLGLVVESSRVDSAYGGILALWCVLPLLLLSLGGVNFSVEEVGSVELDDLVHIVRVALSSQYAWYQKSIHRFVKKPAKFRLILQKAARLKDEAHSTPQ